MTTTVMPAAPGFPSGSDRLVSTRINGVLAALPCFGWCVESHHVQNHRFVEDFSHTSDSADVTVPRLSGRREVFSARVLAWPHSGTAPTVVVDSADDECAELDADQADAFADELIRTASRVRAMAAIVRASQPA